MSVLRSLVVWLALGTSVVVARPQQTVTWNGGTSSWDTASSWSGNVVPENDGSTTYAVKIDGGNAGNSFVYLDRRQDPYTITIDSLSIDAGDTLYYAYLDFFPPSGLQLTDGLDLNGTINFFGGGTLLLGANQAINGTGTIVGGTNGTGFVRSSTGATTIGAGITARGSLIIGDIQQPLMNFGTIRTNAARTLIAGSTITNAGTLLVDANGELAINTTFRRDQLGALINNGQVRIVGTLDNLGQTFRVDNASGNWALGGTLRGGTLETGDGKVLRVDFPYNAVLDDVIVNGEIAVTGGQRLSLASGQSLHGSGTVTLGIGTFGGGSLSSTNSPLKIDSGMTVHGRGNVIGAGIGGAAAPIINAGHIIADSPNNVLDLRGSVIQNTGIIESKPGCILGLGSTFRIDELGTLINNGKIRITGTLDNAGRTFTVSNQSGDWELGGTITGGNLQSLDGRVLTIPQQRTGTLDNVFVQGTIRGLGTLNIPAGQSLAGTGTILGSLLLCDNGNALLTIGSGMTIVGPATLGALAQPSINHGHVIATSSFTDFRGSTLANDGTLEVQANSSLRLTGAFRVSDLGTIINNGTIQIDGIIDNTNQTFQPGVTVPGNWVVNSYTDTYGGFRGGTVKSPVGQPFKFLNWNVALEDVTLEGSFSLSSSATLDVRGSSVLKGNATLSIGTSIIRSSTGTLAIQQGLTIIGGQGTQTIGGRFWSERVPAIYNAGLIVADPNLTPSQFLTSDILQIGGTTVYNTGTLRAIDGGTLLVGTQTIHNAGTIDIADSARVHVGRDQFVQEWGDLVFDDGGVLKVSLSANSGIGSFYPSGRLDVDGLLDLSAANDSLILIAAAGFDPMREYIIASYDQGLLGQFDHVTPNFAVNYSVPGQISVRVVPEPASLMPLVATAVLSIRRSRKLRDRNSLAPTTTQSSRRNSEHANQRHARRFRHGIQETARV